jgi:hypothetical protein
MYTAQRSPFFPSSSPSAEISVIIKRHDSRPSMGLFLALDTQIQWLCEDGYLLPLNLAQNADNGVRLEPIDQ